MLTEGTHMSLECRFDSCFLRRSIPFALYEVRYKNLGGPFIPRGTYGSVKVKAKILRGGATSFPQFIHGNLLLRRSSREGIFVGIPA